MEKKGEKENKKSRSNHKQIKYLVSHMANNINFANGEFKGPLGKTKKEKDWADLTKALNELGPTKTTDAWQRTWRELKKKARNENAEFKRTLNATGNHIEVKPVKDISETILNIIGHDSSLGIGPEESGIGTLEEIDFNTSPPSPLPSTSHFPFSSAAVSPNQSMPDPPIPIDFWEPVMPPAPTSAASAPAPALTPVPTRAPNRASATAGGSGGAQRTRRMRPATNADQFKKLHVAQIEIMKELVTELKKNNTTKVALLTEQRQNNNVLREILNEIKSSPSRMSSQPEAGSTLKVVDLCGSQFEESSGTSGVVQTSAASPIHPSMDPKCQIVDLCGSQFKKPSGTPGVVQTAAASPIRPNVDQKCQILDLCGSQFKKPSGTPGVVQTAAASPIRPNVDQKCQVVAPQVPPEMKTLTLTNNQVKRGKMELVKLKDGTVIFKRRKDD